jgi:hypothetical protein
MNIKLLVSILFSLFVIAHTSVSSFSNIIKDENFIVKQASKEDLRALAKSLASLYLKMENQNVAVSDPIRHLESLSLSDCDDSKISSSDEDYLFPEIEDIELNEDEFVEADPA